MDNQPEYDAAHDYDDDGSHYPEDCEECLLRTDTVVCSCRCGKCCECLIIEASMRDGEREPMIQKLARPLYDDMSGVKEQIGWLLNGKTGPCVFFDQQTRLCTIHETRPLVCRLYDCDTSEFADVPPPPEPADSTADTPAAGGRPGDGTR